MQGSVCAWTSGIFWLQVDTVLCGECEDSTSSSSSSEDEGAGEMGNAKSAESTSGDASNVVPMRKKVKVDKGIALCLLETIFFTASDIHVNAQTVM